MRKVVLFGTNRGGGTPPQPPQLLLDEYPNAAAAYSLRDLASASVGSAVVRVRRSSDNVEQDFTASEITDGTLTTFTGANNGAVTTWYDQSGNGINAVQAVASRQPLIVSSGVVELDNEKPCVYASSGKQLIANLNQLYSLFSVLSFGGNPINFETILGGGGLSNDVILCEATTSTQVYVDPSINEFYQNSNLITGSQPFNVSNINTQKLYSFIFSDTVINGFSLFNRVNTVLGYKGRIQEVILYPSDQSANRTGIETNINTEYTIY